MKKNIPSKTLNNGFSIPEYGLGAYRMGGKRQRDPKNDDEADIQAVKNAIDSGVTHIDTAEIYAGGYSEILVGRAIKPYNRDDLFLVSKASPQHFKHDDLIKSCENSLKRLDVEYLDLYLLHHYSSTVPLKETMAALDDLVRRKLVRNIGVSNFGVKHLQEAQQYSENKIVANQVHYNLQAREPEVKGLLDFCQNNEVILIAWRPLGIDMTHGDYLGKYPEILKKTAEKYNKTPVQIALNWLISQKNVVTLSKTRSLKHLEENLGAVGWYLEESDVEYLRKNYPGQLEMSDVINLS